jgi:hypothetical protein
MVNFTVQLTSEEVTRNVSLEQQCHSKMCKRHEGKLVKEKNTQQQQQNKTAAANTYHIRLGVYLYELSDFTDSL